MLSDRERAMYYICTTTDYIKHLIKTEKYPKAEVFNLYDDMLERCRIARFPTISKEGLKDIQKEFAEENREHIKVIDGVLEFFDHE